MRRATFFRHSSLITLYAICCNTLVCSYCYGVYAMKLRFGVSALALSLALFLPGCHLLDDIITNPDKPSDPPPVHASCETGKLAQIVPLRLIDFASDPYTLQSLTLNGDILCAETHYSGGSEHEFNLLVDDQLTETATGTPVVQAYLVHDSGGDMCLAMIYSKVGMDLTPLKEHLRTLTGQPSGSVLLKVAGATNDIDASVVYSY